MITVDGRLQSTWPPSVATHVAQRSVGSPVTHKAGTGIETSQGSADQFSARVLPRSMYNPAMAEDSVGFRSVASGSLSDARNRLSEIIDATSATGDDFVITKHGQPAAVLMAFDEYESMIETLNILSDEDTMSAIAEGEAQLAAGDLVELDSLA